MSTPSVTITGTLQSLIGAADTTATVVFTLCNFAPQIPRVSGTSILDQITVTVTPNGSGQFTATLYGNDVVSPGPNITFYTVQINTASGNKFTASYQFTGTGTSDLSNLTPIGTVPSAPSLNAVVTNPTANQTITGFPLFVPQLSLNGSSSGSTALVASAVASGTMTVQSGTDFLVARATTDTLTNKTLTSPVLNTPTMTGPSTDTLSLSSVISKYSNISTVANGIPSEYAVVSLTGQTATIGTTTLYAVPSSGAGQYRLTWNSKVTTGAGTSSTLGPLAVTYTDPDGTVLTQTAVAVTASGTGTSTAINTNSALLLGIPLLLNCKASTNIQYSMTYASNPASAMAYNLNILLERM